MHSDDIDTRPLPGSCVTFYVDWKFLIILLFSASKYISAAPTQSHVNSYIFYEVTKSYEFVQPHSFLAKLYVFYELPIRLNMYKWPTPNAAPKPTCHCGLDKSY